MFRSLLVSRICAERQLSQQRAHLLSRGFYSGKVAAVTGTSDFPAQATPVRKKRSLTWVVTVVFAVLILIPSMLGFVMKFMELVNLTQGETDGGFAITPVVNYLLASLGFFFLLLWSAVNGMFNDLEKPKYHMFETEMLVDSVPRNPES